MDFPRKHDTILRYSKGNRYVFVKSEARVPYDSDYKATVFAGDDTRAPGRTYTPDPSGKVVEDWWRNIPRPYGKDVIGYPTQKPELLLERIIKTSSNEGDVVADFFVGGGTTAVVAQRTGRRFIVGDQSRVAIAVTAERLKQSATMRGLRDAAYLDFVVEQWGIYEAERLSAMPAGQFRDFVLRAYGATRIDNDADAGSYIHGWRNRLPIWVGAPGLASQATSEDVLIFANTIRQTTEYRQADLRNGIMLAWGFRQDAREAAEELRLQEHIDVNFVRLSQIRIGDSDFREHIVGRSTDRADYSEFLTFVQPPVVNVGYRALGGGSVTFDAGDTAVVNLGADLINVQWDFNYNGRRFEASQGYSFQRQGNGKNRKPVTQVTHKFDGPGRYNVACRVQDSRGGEGMWTGVVEAR